MTLVTEVSQLLAAKPVTVGHPIAPPVDIGAVEDPVDSGLFDVAGIVEDPVGSGLYELVGIPLIETSPGLFLAIYDWELHVERLVGAEGGAIWDMSEWATDSGDTNPNRWIWSELEWESLNDVTRGMEWTRGADQPNGRPRNGEIVVTLANPMSGVHDPWVNYAHTRPGVIMRAGITSATDTRADGWVPLWTGLVESWDIVKVGARDSGYRADSYAEVRLIETLSWLARINGNSIGSPVGFGDTIVDRVERLLDAAVWPFGQVSLLDPVGEPAIALQSTDMSLNRLAELYLSADSVLTTGAFGGGGIVCSDVTGAALVTTRSAWRLTRLGEFSSAFGGVYSTIGFGASDTTGGDMWTIAYDPDSVDTANDPEGIVNDHRYTRVGGTQQLFPHPISIGQFGRSTRARNDLIMTTDANALVVAQADNNREARTALRVDAVEIVATGRLNALLAIAAIDFGDNILFDPPNGTSFTGRGNGVVRSLTHTLTPHTRSGVHWAASYALDFTGFVDLPGSILPEA